MVQQWIHADPAVDLVAMVVEDDPRLRRMAVFDAIVNNTDRKGGHLLPMPDGHVYGVDHGVTLLDRARSSGRSSGAGSGCRSTTRSSRRWSGSGRGSEATWPPGSQSSSIRPR